MPHVKYYLLGLVAIALALFGAISKRWPAAEAVVLASTATTRNTEPDTYTARVTYQYTVGGQRYLGSRISFGYRVGGYSQDAAKALAHKFVAGSQVPVYYLPSWPSLSVLTTGIPKPILGWLVFLSLLGGLLLFMVVHGVA